MTAWTYLRHPDTGAEALFPDSPDVVALYEAKGWVRAEIPAAFDPDAAETGATYAALDAAPEPEQPEPPSEQPETPTPDDPPAELAVKKEK